MLKINIVALFTTLLFSSAVIAGAGHEHDHGHDNGHGHSHGPVSSDAVSKDALKKVSRLVKAGKIDASWSDKKVNSVSKKTFSKGPEWVITINNSDVGDPDKQTLYLFYTLDGRYIAANYSGN